MSTVIVNTLTGTSTAGSISVTGEGGSTTTNLQQGLIKVWCFSYVWHYAKSPCIVILASVSRSSCVPCPLVLA